MDSDFQLPRRSVRKSYLITYSQADLTKFATREAFGTAVEQSFNEGASKIKSLHWVCSKENHVEKGFHYHVAIKLDGNKRWLGSKNFLLNTHGISVHFSDGHNNYYDAYKYVTKEDTEAFHSKDHPDLSSAKSPKTSKCTKRLRKTSKERLLSTCGSSKQLEPKTKNRRLSNLEVSRVLIEKNLHNEIDLLALAEQQKQEGKTNLAEFVLTKNQKALNDLIDTTWKMNKAPMDLVRSKQSRTSLIKNALELPCADGCNQMWFQCAREVLINNNVNTYVFAAGVRELLRNGRGKYRNVMIIGPANCGKTFILNPLNSIFNTFTNPATTSYAWVGAENSEVIFLNDFRWTTEILAWKDMLLLLEGQTLHLPAPKSHYSKDILFDRDTPIFATSKERITFLGKYNLPDERETEMMNSRWRVFNFHHQIAEEHQKDIPVCSRCFAQLIMFGEEES